MKAGAAKHRKELYEGARGEWRLSTRERKRILLNNVYGVDIDPQAVEVTKLSLLLKVLEGESQETINAQLRLFHERALPDLSRNIKCGNSLVGPDFWEGKQMRLFDGEERLRINAFDWKAEFPEIVRDGGFDAVVGNPPYVRIQGLPGDQVDYLTSRYRSATGNCDLYVSFVERGFALLRSGGLFGFIIPNKFLRTDYGKGLRSVLSRESAVTRIVDFGVSQVFAATTYTCLLFLRKGGSASFEYAEARASPESLQSAIRSKRESGTLCSTPWTFETRETAALLVKLAKGARRLLDLPAEMSRGSSTGDDQVFVFEKGALEVEAGIVREPMFATDFTRYRFGQTGQWRILFPYTLDDGSYRPYAEVELKKLFPQAFAYLHANQAALRRRKQWRVWFGYSAPRNLDLHDGAQIAIPLLADRGLFAMIPRQLRGRLCPMASGGFTLTISEQCLVKPEYVLGLLNSRLLFWRLAAASNLFRGGWITCTKQYFGELPIRLVEMSDRAANSRHDKVVELVRKMLALRDRTAKTDYEKATLQREIDAVDRQIDELVYDLYGLTRREIELVEEETRPAETARGAR